MLLDLNEDLLLRVCEFLSPEDIVRVSLVCKQLHDSLDVSPIYHLMYTKKFGLNAAVLDNYNWKQIFGLRCSSRNSLYTWGSSQLGRLGYLVKSVSADSVSRTGLNAGIHHPCKLPNFDGFLVTALSSNGFSFQVLTNDGSLYITGNDFRKMPPESTAPGPREPDETAPLLHQFRSRYVTGVPNDQPHIMPVTQVHQQTNPNLRLTPEQLLSDPATRDIFDLSQVPAAKDGPAVEETAFVTKCKLPAPSRILSLSSGRQHFIALDHENNIYTWDSGLAYRSVTGIKVEFPDLPIKSPYITKIKCGWSTSSCYIKDLGIVVWYSRARMGLRDKAAKVNYWLVPDKKGEIVDYHLGNDFILIIKKDQGLFGINVDTGHFFHNVENATKILDEFFPLTSFNRWQDNYNQQHGTTHEFSKVDGCYNSFVVYTTQTVLFGDKEMVVADQEEVGEPKQFDLPPNVIDVAMGDYHYLALTAEGELYSWGYEPDNCGCLGIGPSEAGQSTKTVSVPQKVVKPGRGKWISITASGWHSGGIFAPDSESE